MVRTWKGKEIDRNTLGMWTISELFIKLYASLFLCERLNICFGQFNWSLGSKLIEAVSNWVSRLTRDFFAFAYLRLVIGQEISNHFLKQSCRFETKTDSRVWGSFSFSLGVFTGYFWWFPLFWLAISDVFLCSDWLLSSVWFVCEISFLL